MARFKHGVFNSEVRALSQTETSTSSGSFRSVLGCSAPSYRRSGVVTFVFALLALLVPIYFNATAVAADAVQTPLTSRAPTNDVDLKYWLENMVRHHQFSLEEVEAATGLTPALVQDALRKFNITASRPPRREPDAPLLVLPYPGGRHPRIGFLDGAVRPQRETKISVFTPWDETSYVVVDVPEAIWSNLGLTYLAHTHIPTIFDKQGTVLESLEWNRRTDGTFDAARRLPNGISFGTLIRPARDAVRMEMWLSNGTDRVLTDLRVQNCVMLKGAAGFTAQTNANKVLSKPYAACRSDDGSKWIITGWEPCHRSWANPPVPCLHSDPKFPDCPPGEIRRLKGWLSFYRGTNIQEEFARLEKLGWSR